MTSTHRGISGAVAVACLLLALLPLMIIGCQLGIGVGDAATPHPLPPPTPTLEERRVQTGPEIGNNTKVIDGYLHVWYIPCPRYPSPPITWVAPISVTDLQDGSNVYLNRDGTLRASPKPKYKSEEDRIRLEAALNDSSVMKQVVARPSCDDRQSDDRRIRQQGGWPDAYAEDIGEPAIPKVAISTVPSSTLGVAIYPGWRGSYCWRMNGDKQECEDVEYWEGFAEANALLSRPDSTFHFTVLGDEASPGRISRVRMYTIQKQWSLRKLRQIVKRGEEVYSVEAQDGQRLDAIKVPDTLVGNYMLIASYGSALGEVEYGFKVTYGG